MKLGASVVAALLTFAVGLSTAGAQATLYWDINDTGSGAGNVGGFTDGRWGTDPNDTNQVRWNTDPDGLLTTAAWTAGSHAVFSAGTDAVDSFVEIIDAALLPTTQTAASVRIQEGTVFIASGILDVLGGDIIVESGTTFRINTISRLAATGGKVILNGGTLFQSNAGQAGSFLNASKSIEINGTGTLNYTSLNTNNSPGAGTVSIYTPDPASTATILGTGGTTTEGGAGTLIKTGLHEFRYNGAGTAKSTFAKLVVNQGLYRLGSVVVATVQQTTELGFGAAPVAPLADAITLDGGAIGLSFSTTLHANRGITIGPNGGTFQGSGLGTMTVPGSLTAAPGTTMTVTGRNLTAASTTFGNSGGGVTLSNVNNINTFQGNVVVDTSTLTLNESLTTPNFSGTHIITPATASPPPAQQGPITSVGTVTIATGKTFTVGSDNASTSYDGRVTGAGAFTKVGSGVLTLNSVTPTSNVSSEWSNTGGINIQGGSIKFGAATAGFSNAAAVHISPGANLDMNSIADGFGGLVGGGSVINHNATTGVALTLAGAATYSFHGTIDGAGSVIHSGNGTQTFSGANTYSGGTTVSDGILMVNNLAGSGTGSGAVAVTGGTLGGNGTIDGLITVSGTGHVSPGTSIGTLTAAGGLTLDAGSILDFELGAPGISDLITAGGITTINGGSVVLTDDGGLAAGNYTLIDYAGTLVGSVLNLGTPTGPAGFSFNLSDTGSSIDLTVSSVSAALIGDYNNDGTVNAADYAVWRDNNGGTAVLPNDDTPGAVDVSDYNTWRANFGETAGSGAGSGAVPEPSTIALALLSVVAMLGAARKRG